METLLEKKAKRASIVDGASIEDLLKKELENSVSWSTIRLQEKLKQMRPGGDGWYVEEHDNREKNQRQYNDKGSLICFVESCVVVTKVLIRPTSRVGIVAFATKPLTSKGFKGSLDCRRGD